MNGFILAPVMLLHIMDLGMAVVAGRDTVIGPGFGDLLELEPAIVSACLGKAGLKKTAPTAAAEVIRPVRIHVDEIFFTDHRFDDKSKVFGDRIPQRFSHQLAGVLYRKLDLEIPVPVRIDLQFSLPNPLGVIFDDAFDLEIMVDFESVQSDPD